MKRKTKIFSAILIIIVVAVIAFIVIINISAGAMIKSTDVGMIDTSSISDGVYSGTYDTGVVKVALDVTVRNNAIENITITEHICGTGKKAEAIAQDVIDKQTIQVDSVSGATLSSKAILKAIENALNSN